MLLKSEPWPIFQNVFSSLITLIFLQYVFAIPNPPRSLYGHVLAMFIFHLFAFQDFLASFRFFDDDLAHEDQGLTNFDHTMGLI